MLTVYKLFVLSSISHDTQYCNTWLEQESWKTGFEGEKNHNLSS